MAKTINEEKDSSPNVGETMQDSPFTEAEKKALKSIASRGGKIVDELAFERFKIRQRGECDYLACAYYLKDDSGAVLTGLIGASNPKVPFAGIAMERTIGDHATESVPKAPDFSRVGTSREMALAITLAKENTSTEGPKDLTEENAKKYIAAVKRGDKPTPKKTSEPARPAVTIRVEIVNAAPDMTDAELKDLSDLLKSIITKREEAAKKPAKEAAKKAPAKKAAKKPAKKKAAKKPAKA